MFKIMFCLWRRPGLTPEQFRHYYEDVHVHNNQKVRPASADYRRNYPDPADPLTDMAGLARLGSFDVMTENWYPDRKRFEAVLQAFVNSPATPAIVEDEAQFEVRDRKLVFVVSESPTFEYGSSEYEKRAMRNDRAGYKLLRFVSKHRGQTPADFRSEYEAGVAAQIAEQFGSAFDYRRNYLLFDDPLTFRGPQESPSRIERERFPADLVEEFWFDNREGALRDVENLKGREFGAAISGSHDAATIAVREHRLRRPEELLPAGEETRFSRGEA